MAYQIEGRILEVCDCETLCPCWIGQDPDNGTCDAIVAWHVDQGAVNGVDVSGRTLAMFNHIPGNILQGQWKVALIVDDGATDDQQESLLSVFTGKLGGPIADLAQLVGDVVAVERAPITFTVDGGKGRLSIGSLASAELEPFVGTTGKPTALHDTVFSTIPGSPAYVGKATSYQRRSSQFGMRDIALQDHNAIQGSFRFVG